MQKVKIRGAALVFLFSLLWLTTSVSLAGEIVSLKSGDVRGEKSGNTYQYLGIPYAAPPVNQLRWKAPQEMEAWQGVRDARSPGSACSQIGNFFTTDDEKSFNKPYGSEDCLFLNVWVPNSEKKKRPLLIFFHGGSGIFGRSYHEIYNGARLAAETDAVVITANYRLGIWGSFQSPALKTGNPEEDSGNFLLLDMIKVLDWARENCAALSCDPDNITISGQSAGAVFVLALMRSPAAKGKFQRAISFSGIPFSASYEEGKEQGDKFIAQLLIKDGKAESSADAESIISKMSDTELGNYLRGKTETELAEASEKGVLPKVIADGTVVSKPESSREVTCELINKVPLMIGNTRDELSTLVTTRMYDLEFNKLWPLFNGEERTKTVSQELGLIKGMVRNILIQYLERKYSKKLQRCIATYSESLPALYQYEFVWDNFPDPWLLDFGSFHGLDVPILFGNYIEDRPSYMRFAWTKENRKEREDIHAVIAASIKNFIHGDDAKYAAPLGDSWKSRTTSNYVQYYGATQ
ncbi:carboxylesterase family protein [Zhongshania aquimaris]|uniref:Carboxylesterase family protein n=1 Tax=Zhongshania aquimaris TaxID=2857107 RepID=A0ABS6VP84_9GAMM|nr:carboxylesterase family protein [Zhongshania aquimaris]MBW2940125.1 carboxylesterase family protein [Zhongshania aquimaris]